MINFNDLKKLASHLNIKASKINVQEWATVLFVNGRFVSKRIVYANGDNRVFKRFIKSHASNWNLFDLKLLNKVQLQTISVLLGIPKSGTKQVIINRIKAIVPIRLMVASFMKLAGEETAKLQALSSSFLGRELRTFCRTVRTYAPGNKYGMASSLFNWLKGCLRMGQQAYSEMIQQIKAAKSKVAA